MVFGFVKNNEVSKLQKDYDAYGTGVPSADFENTKKKRDDAASMRNIMYISGGVALAFGIGVHIWF